MPRRRSTTRTQPATRAAPAAPRLPLRWVVILLAAAGLGFAVGAASEPVTGVLSAIAAVTVLDQISP
jgi:hypothetical protein